MKKMLVANLKRMLNVLEYPELIQAKRNHISTKFVKDLFFIKKRLGIVPKTVLDVGAAIGVYSRAIRFVFPDAFIYAFEPIPASYAKLKKLERNEDRLKAFNFALADENKMADFYLNDFSFSSSLLKMTNRHKELFPFTNKERIIKVECKRMDALKDIQIKKPALSEVNFEKFYDRQANYDDIFSFMLRSGFRRFIQVDTLYTEKGKLVASDLIFWG